MTTVTLVHNPTSGLQPVSARPLLSLLDRAGYGARYLSIKRRRNLAADLRAARGLIAVAGGDGSVAKVLLAAADRAVQVAIIPTGVANNIARSFGIYGPPPRVITAWRASRPQPLDIGTVEIGGVRRRIVESIGIGALAEAAARTPHRETSAYGRTGKLTDSRQRMTAALAAARPIPRLRIDGREIGDALFVEILNIAMTGPNISLARTKPMGDGLLTLVYACEKHRAALLEWLESGAEPAQMPGLPPLTAPRFKVAWEGAQLRLDDSFPPLKTGKLRVATERARARVLAPI
jgi:diacylglycerol kinase family enzyme